MQFLVNGLLSYLEIVPKTQYYCTGYFDKNHQERILYFYNFLIHIHVLMLCRKLELISIKLKYWINVRPMAIAFSCWPKY